MSGRAGRAELPGEVFIQTYSPDHPAIRAAASDAGFEPFAARELAEREAGGFPPFCRLACLTFRGASEEKVRFSAETFARALAQAGGAAALRVSGVCAAPLAKAKGLYRYQILLRAAAARQLTRPLREVMARPLLASGVSLAVDVDAVNLM